MRALRPTSRIQDQELEFAWEQLISSTVTEEDGAGVFEFEYAREGKKPKRVKLFTQFVRASIRILDTKYHTEVMTEKNVLSKRKMRENRWE